MHLAELHDEKCPCWTPPFCPFASWKWTLFLLRSGHLHSTQDDSWNSQPSLPPAQNPPFSVYVKGEQPEKLLNEKSDDKAVTCPINIFSSSAKIHMKPTVVSGWMRASEWVWGGIYGNMQQINCNYQRCGVSICLCLELLRGKTSGTIYFLFWERADILFGIMCCHRVGIKHLNEQTQRGLFRDPSCPEICMKSFVLFAWNRGLLYLQYMDLKVYYYVWLFVLCSLQ